MAGTPFHKLPRFQAGCKMPTERSISQEMNERRTAAEYANQRFLAALNRYFEMGGRG